MKMRERTSFSNVRIIGGGRLLRRCENQLTVSSVGERLLPVSVVVSWELPVAKYLMS